mmetsp:Transcript_6603/g.15206  ORF Transcript_6603/g.15206 Transcript_6603/m.15206 type:complete len:83 (-) Transcript_6603:1670-1918(-)
MPGRTRLQSFLVLFANVRGSWQVLRTLHQTILSRSTSDWCHVQGEIMPTDRFRRYKLASVSRSSFARKPVLRALRDALWTAP